jgi:hypothetical protein
MHNFKTALIYLQSYVCLVKGLEVKHIKSPNITDVETGARGKCGYGDYYISLLLCAEAIYRVNTKTLLDLK